MSGEIEPCPTVPPVVPSLEHHLPQECRGLTGKLKAIAYFIIDILGIYKFA